MKTNGTKTEYDVISPDGFSISATETYPTIMKAYRAFVTWKERFKEQGYYSSTLYGRIHLLDIRDYCQFVEVEINN